MTNLTELKAPIVAVRPARGRIVHLHQADYQPGERTRPDAGKVAMCGAAIWPNGEPKREYVKTPLAAALEWTSLEPSDTDPRPAWTWCRPCIGHAVVSTGMARASLLAVARTEETR